MNTPIYLLYYSAEGKDVTNRLVDGQSKFFETKSEAESYAYCKGSYPYEGYALAKVNGKPINGYIVPN